MAYSKTKVNRAGALFADRVRETVEGKVAVGDPWPGGQEALEIIQWWRSDHAKPLSQVAASLRYYVADEGPPIVAQRLKRVPTIATKLLREPKMRLARMGDIGGVRAVLPSQSSAYHVASRLRKNWTITRFSDYVSGPKPDGYRALHLINRHHGRLIEVQLRTRLQDGWANAVEADSRWSPGLKFGAGAPELREFYLALGEVCAAADQGIATDKARVDQLAALQQRADTFRREQQK